MKDPHRKMNAFAAGFVLMGAVYQASSGRAWITLVLALLAGWNAFLALKTRHEQ